MKKIFLVLLFLLVLLSCRKAVETTTASLPNILKEYRWQKIQNHSYKFPLDTSQLITYADTSQLLFDAPQFTRNTQYTIVHAVFGSGRPQFQLQNHRVTFTGDYRLQPVDSLLQLNYKAKTGGYPPWNIPSTDTVFQEAYKVLKLDNTMLILRHLPGPGSTFPPLNLVDTFRTAPR